MVVPLTPAVGPKSVVQGAATVIVRKVALPVLVRFMISTARSPVAMVNVGLSGPTAVVAVVPLVNCEDIEIGAN